MLEHRKVYQEVLDEIQRLMKVEGWRSGDKLPSERALAEQFNAARSSIREALRAIELLGIIETRKGEGTFLREYQSYHMVNLLASFVLTEQHTAGEVQEVKTVLEQYVVCENRPHIDAETIKFLEDLLADSERSMADKHHQFFSIFFIASRNQLLFKIWRLLQDFSEDNENNWYEIKVYYDIVNKYKHDQAIMDKTY
ncbi:transcriptional regulator [Gracilibacillus halophilus YIM-C55.5]|uniref:Transcriptional regulator n=1 Tax=Gracilibacillus halophilus YIM-C55.5 TaxID=1308866 RepID=N4W9J3_9BACI|nr:GntR family transcriptional regulator [Gracilibacillus halophilus]ENH96953.1 transcriptional regulator [Gracilibacillus halophilus YIM-C55.5]